MSHVHGYLGILPVIASTVLMIVLVTVGSTIIAIASIVTILLYLIGG